jgi:hypothetical protein
MAAAELARVRYIEYSYWSGRARPRLDGERRVEEPLARAQDDRMYEKAIFVDQAGRDERPREPRPPCASVSTVVAVRTGVLGQLSRRWHRAVAPRVV